MADTVERTQTVQKGAKPAEALEKAEIKMSAAALKEIHSATPAPVSETKVSRNVVQDLRSIVESCKNNHEVAKRFGLDDKVKLSAIEAAVAHAEKTGRLPGGVDAALTQKYKTSIVRNKLDARRAGEHPSARLNPAHPHHHAHHHQHDINDLRHELLANLLNNRQLAGLQKGSKTIQEQKEELGFGGEIPAEKSVDEALQERLQFLMSEQQGESQEDRTEEHVDLAGVDVDTGFANELRNQSEFGFLQQSEGRLGVWEQRT